MSGIIGWIDYDKNLIEQDRQMFILNGNGDNTNPDVSGFWKTNECLLLNEKQIMIRGQGGTKYIISFNGRLYNRTEIEQKLIKLGYIFNDYSDAEVIIFAYMAWGERCLEEFNGIYAISIWNDTNKILFIARDRVGVKPLFYYNYDNGIIFASEIKTLLLHEKIRPVVDKNGIASLILLGPAKQSGSGIFKGIKEIPPGNFAIFSKKSFIIKSYWKLKAEKHTENLDETAVHIKELLTDSIKRQLESEAPLCTFLSGGLDSSIISAIASRNYIENGERLSTCSLDYKDNRVNFKASAFQPDEDAPWVNEMTNFLGSSHKDIIIDTPQLADTLRNAMHARDLPGMGDVDSSLFLFLREVKKNFAVGLSGECADELVHRCYPPLIY